MLRLAVRGLVLLLRCRRGLRRRRGMRCWESAASHGIRLGEGEAGHRVRVRVVGIGPGLTQGRHTRHRREEKGE